MVLNLLLKRIKGKQLMDWLSIPYQKLQGISDEINNGIEFPAKYDRRHDLSITATHKLSKILGAAEWSICLCNGKCNNFTN